MSGLRIVDDLPLSGAEVPATVSYDITWTPFGPTRTLQPGSSAPTDPTDLDARFQDARAAGTFSGASVTMPGGSSFSFQSEASNDSLWGEIGHERNGRFLTPGGFASPRALRPGGSGRGAAL